MLGLFVFAFAIFLVSAFEDSVPEIMSSETAPRVPFSTLWSRERVEEALKNRVVGFDIASQKLLFDTPISTHTSERPNSAARNRLLRTHPRLAPHPTGGVHQAALCGCGQADLRHCTRYLVEYCIKSFSRAQARSLRALLLSSPITSSRLLDTAYSLEV